MLRCECRSSTCLSHCSQVPVDIAGLLLHPILARASLRALPHLAALLLQTARALFLPLPTKHRPRLLVRIRLVRTTAEAQHEVERRLLLDIIIRQGPAVLELLAGKDQPLLIGRDSFLVLDFGLHIVDRIARFYVQRDSLSCESLHEDLHGCPPRSSPQRARTRL